MNVRLAILIGMLISACAPESGEYINRSNLREDFLSDGTRCVYYLNHGGITCDWEHKPVDHVTGTSVNPDARMLYNIPVRNPICDKSNKTNEPCLWSKN